LWRYGVGSHDSGPAAASGFSNGMISRNKLFQGVSPNVMTPRLQTAAQVPQPLQ
jgi:hypothetical protein